MDQNLLEQIATLNRLNLSPDLIRELIEHDKWKTKEQHRHEKELLLLGQQKTPISPSSNDTFNSDTSGGMCTSSHEGLIAKSKVMSGAVIKARELLKSRESDLPQPLVSFIIGSSWCGQRLERWPQASDSKIALSIQSDFDKMVEKFGVKAVLKAIDLVSKSLDSWDPRIISEQIEVIQSKHDKEVSLSIVSSPLFAELKKSYPEIDPELFDECYTQNREQFSAAAIHLLRRSFRKSPPEELSHIEGWQQRWQQHLPNYLKQWQEELRKMELRMRIAQRAWKESIS